jgi:hypothetical protein
MKHVESYCEFCGGAREKSARHTAVCQSHTLHHHRYELNFNASQPSIFTFYEFNARALQSFGYAHAQTVYNRTSTGEISSCASCS